MSVNRTGNTPPYRLLDAWRGVAALWVVMLHVHLPTTPALLSWVSTLGFLGVPMFFVISGYCIASAATRSCAADRPGVHFVKARVRRIYPPYFFASLLAAVLSLLLGLLVRHHIVAGSQIAGLNLLHQSGWFYLGALTLTQLPLHVTLIIPVFWSLCYEIAFYAVVALLLFGMARSKPSLLFLLDALGILTVGVLFWLDLAWHTCHFPWNLWPQFGLGALVYQMLGQPQRRLPRWLFLFCAVLILVLAFQHWQDGFTNGVSGGLQALFYLGFSLLLLLLFRWDSFLAKLRVVRALSWVGMFSYSLYLIHLLALGLVTQGLSRIAGLESHPLLIYGIKFALCIAVGRLFFHCFERPFLDSHQRQARLEAARRASPALAPSPETL